MTTTRSPERVVIIGGSSGMGLALASALIADGAEVTIAGRSADRLAAAQHAVPGGPGALRAVTADITSEADLERLFAEADTVDHVVTTGGPPPRCLAQIAHSLPTRDDTTHDSGRWSGQRAQCLSVE
ncbi:SDR family NAD(P)-dependent oxidoreductase [Nocardia sp. NPDC050710]|uniref:SDR family NAD(P)-dependent oxidoreductase n=1 Tax=Nocardia sp. NPDC050710 TaxID=3157220 RepID=UPI0033D00CF5